MTVGLPTPRDEAWRYTPVDEIVGLLAEATAPTGRVESLDRLVAPLAGPRLVVVNGRFAPELSDLADLCGVRMGSLAELAVDVPGNLVRDDGFQARNRAEAADGAAVVVDLGVEVVVPIQVVHVAAPGDDVAVTSPRTVVVAGRDSHVSVVETFCGTGGAVVTNASTVVRAEPGARVHVTRIEDESDAAVHVGHTRVEAGEGADVGIVSLLLGADIARHAVDAVLAGRDARVEVDGLAVPDGHRRHDHVVTVEHAVSGGTSRQRFKAVVDDHGRSSFSGHVIVRPGTTGTDADQSTRNLLLAPTAEADARPWLEILADDVTCTHGATVGRLDDDALFYLRSRGIPLEEARRLLIAAFVRDVLEHVPHAELREHLVTRTERRIRP